ncbi:MAG TPA: hypothetical protein VND19_13685 [Acetobacteraceae bacterium]|nr:hypothetical protein [Acetobacteraceae bacterium]
MQVTFSRLIVPRTFFSPFPGRRVDRFGPRRLVAAGVLTAPLAIAALWPLRAAYRAVA